jgi:hypothetical protein
MQSYYKNKLIKALSEITKKLDSINLELYNNAVEIANRLNKMVDYAEK